MEQEFLAPKGWYEPWEICIENWGDLQTAITEVLDLNARYKFVWRGLPNAAYANLSKLSRSFGSGIYPEENALRNAEKKILDLARNSWRIDTSHVELFFAKLQHLGAPTRLIDITRNAYVAAWFACSTSGIESNTDGRLIGFATAGQELPEVGYGHLSAQNRQVPIWHIKKHREHDLDWGSNKSKVTVWFPPARTHPRIFAQNAGFIYDGVPKRGTGANNGYPKGPTVKGVSPGKWKLDEIMQATSVHISLVRSDKKIKAQTKTPMITIRIPHSAKEKILEALNKELAINYASLFPEEEGMAQYLSDKHGISDLGF